MTNVSDIRNLQKDLKKAVFSAIDSRKYGVMSSRDNFYANLFGVEIGRKKYDIQICLQDDSIAITTEDGFYIFEYFIYPYKCTNKAYQIARNILRKIS